jgi:hypothetical protein
MAVIANDRVRLTENGHYASRAVASAFDPLLRPKAAAEQPRFSRAL